MNGGSYQIFNPSLNSFHSVNNGFMVPSFNQNLNGMNAFNPFHNVQIAQNTQF